MMESITGLSMTAVSSAIGIDDVDFFGGSAAASFSTNSAQSSSPSSRSISRMSSHSDSGSSFWGEAVASTNINSQNYEQTIKPLGSLR